MSERLDVENIIEDTMLGKYLSFKLGDETYGIEISYVKEIVGIQPITIMPEMPEYIKGVINLRGSIIPVMDARLKFKKKEIEYTDRTCIIVVHIHEFALGIIVDVVTEVINIEEEAIKPPPELVSKGEKYIKYIGKFQETVVLIIDCERIVSENDLEMIAS